MILSMTNYISVHDLLYGPSIDLNRADEVSQEEAMADGWPPRLEGWPATARHLTSLKS